MCCAYYLLVQVPDTDKKTSLTQSRRKKFVLQDQPDNNWDIFSCIEGFDYPIFSKCHHRNALEAVYAVVLGGSTFSFVTVEDALVSVCKWRGVRPRIVDCPTGGNALSLDLRPRAKHHFSCSNIWPRDKYTLFDIFKCLSSWIQSISSVSRTCDLSTCREGCSE